jgi:hypothetical protein
MEVAPQLEDVRKNMQRAFTQKTTALANERKYLESQVEMLKQKADMYDNIASDPDKAIEILSRMSGKSSNTRSVDPDDDVDDFSDYGENAESMRRIVKAVARENKKMLREEFAPLLKSNQENAFQKELSNLSSWVKTQSEKTGLDLPNPNDYAPTIMNLMNAGLTPVKAYQAAINLDKVQFRKPVIGDKKTKPGTFQPGGAKPEKKSISKFGTDEAVARRQQGKRGGYTIEELSAMFDKGEL